jgi:RimJ/RimL family protein N-acetyltransferase
MPNGPYPTLASFEEFANQLPQHSGSMFPFVVFDKEGKAVGFISFLNIQTGNRSIEIGAIIFGTGLQRTTGATEVGLLLMGYAFELGFLRVCTIIPQYSLNPIVLVWTLFSFFFGFYFVFLGFCTVLAFGLF